MRHLDLQIKPSKYILILGTFFLSLTAYALWMSPCPVMISLVFFSLYSIYLWQHIILLLGSKSIRHIYRDTEGQWYLKREETWQAVTLQSDTLITNFVTILRFKISKQYRIESLIIFPDALAIPYQFFKVSITHKI